MSAPTLFEAAPHPTLVPFDGSFRVEAAPTTPPPESANKKALRRELEGHVDRLRSLQRRLYAHDRWSLLLVFQAMDAAGKDGTIRAVLGQINPVGCQVFSFKAPSHEERDHDFLWRTSKRLPERGRIGVFNRSYYEEVLVVRVHPHFLEAQKLPREPAENFWKHRFESIRDHELHLARNGTVVLKFWLHVSKEEQRQRFLARLNEPQKNWKFNAGDVRERSHWDAYMRAYEEALNATSRPWAPWYAVPADNKPWMRAQVAQIVTRTLEALGPDYPAPAADERERFDEMRRLLESE